MKTYNRVLTIAGSDSGGGAGIQADLKTFSSLGCYGTSVITALTAQNTKQVTSIFPTSAQFVKEQLEAVLSDIGTDAIKIGMLFAPDIIYGISQVLKNYENIPIVLDPVMVSKSGAPLLQKEAISALQEMLFPFTSVLTPNLPEATLLLQKTVATKVEMEQAAKNLSKKGPAAVVIKGGHLLPEEVFQSPDCIYVREQDCLQWCSTPRIKSRNLHGTGCTFSSAIAAYLAKGEQILPAITKAKDYLFQALLNGAEYQIGQGYGPVHHFYKFW